MKVNDTVAHEIDVRFDESLAFRHLAASFKDERKIHRLPLVYVVQTSNLKYLKVGRATDFKRRLSALQCGCPYKLGFVTGVRTPVPAEVEAFIHERLSHARVRGEWFELNDLDFEWLLGFVEETNKDVRSAYQEAASIRARGGR